MATEGIALRKRQQIAKANRTMFLWVAGISAVVGIAVVASIFLAQKALFNEKVLSEKSKTASTLVKNNEAVGGLQDQIRVLNTNERLRENMVAGQEQPIQVVLDALPSEANSAAFGASLQKRFLEASGIRLESLDVAPVRDAESISGGSMDSADSSGSEIQFTFSVSTDANNANALKALLVRLERSIRPITLTNITVEAQGSRLMMRAEGNTYYEPTRTAELKDKVVRP